MISAYENRCRGRGENARRTGVTAEATGHCSVVALSSSSDEILCHRPRRQARDGDSQHPHQTAEEPLVAAEAGSYNRTLGEGQALAWQYWKKGECQRSSKLDAIGPDAKLDMDIAKATTPEEQLVGKLQRNF